MTNSVLLPLHSHASSTRFIRHWLTSCVIFLGAFSWSAAAEPEAVIPLVVSGQCRCVIVYPDDCRLSARTADKLADYLQEQTDVRVPIVFSNKFERPDKGTAVIVLDGTEDHRLASGLGVQLAVDSTRPDAFVLKTLRRENASTLVLLLGKGPTGAKYAAYRLMRELRISGRDAAVAPLDLRVEPFLQTRSVSLFNVWGMPIELTRRHNIESWSLDDLQHYIDMYDFFGFSAVESHDRFNDGYLQPLFGMSRAEWCEKVQRMADFAHANGQQLFLRFWGHSVMETPKLERPLGPAEAVPKVLKHLCPADPAQKKRWEAEIRDYYVDHYAGRIDQWIGHWCDPGICREGGCTYRTPLELQMELHRAFKARDPKCRSCFSLWYFDNTKGNPAAWAQGGWIGYEDDFMLINSGVLDKDIIIATYTTLDRTNKLDRGYYKEDVVNAIIRAGHQPALWTWYRADYETRASLHIHLHALGEYFGNLPPSARQLAWHNIERNVHGAANTATYYIAGRLMWEPQLSADDLFKEFLALTFGPENAGKVMPAYWAIEKIRCRGCSMKAAEAQSAAADTASAQQDGDTARAALARLSEVKMQPDFRPRLPLDVAPPQIIADLTASLEVLRDFADCRAKELPELDKTISDGNRAKASELLDSLQAKYKPWSRTLAGREEWSELQSYLNAARKQLRN